MANFLAIARAAMLALGYPQGETLDLPKGPQVLSRHKIRFNAFGGGEFATKTIQGFKFVVVPKGFRFYKGMHVEKSPRKFYEDKEFPHPSYYATRGSARLYTPEDVRRPYRFETKRDLLLLLFNDEDNIRLLGEKFSDPEMNLDCQQSILKVPGTLGWGNEVLNAERELYIVAGFDAMGYGCDRQEAIRREIEDEFEKNGLEDYTPNFHDRVSNVLCAQMKDGKAPQHRFSVADIDDQVSRNLCCVMAELGIPCDGYIADYTATAWGGGGVPEFHEEIMVCYMPDAMKVKWRGGERPL